MVRSNDARSNVTRSGVAEPPSKAWECPSHAWKGLSHVWKDPSQSWEGPSQAWKERPKAHPRPERALPRAQEAQVIIQSVLRSSAVYPTRWLKRALIAVGGSADPLTPLWRRPCGASINPRPDGSLDFPPPDGVGVFEHPHLHRLLRIVEQNGNRRSKAR